MNLEHAPTPWRHETTPNWKDGGAKHKIYAANGAWVCDVPIAADAQMIVAAVNALDEGASLVSELANRSTVLAATLNREECKNHPAER